MVLARDFFRGSEIPRCAIANCAPCFRRLTSSFIRAHEAIGLRPASQIVVQPIEWLWPGRLLLGKLAIFDGDPGMGKSLVCLDLCARLRTGRPLPDGSLGPGRAIRAAAETNWLFSRSSELGVTGGR